jgi:hypothetical protein
LCGGEAERPEYVGKTFHSRFALPAYLDSAGTPKAQVRFGDYTSKWIAPAC